ncbi:HEAT repeat domain-containing protein [Ralstonia pseudosolanacearum]|uniref:HEAT repeat domain-containing protein n=1 Tax=Ralstonia pseudosolanacearum TaxID=1310165 RepID=UPI0033974EFD
MNGPDCVIPAIISPLVGRHAADAAFYWLQLDQSVASFQLTPARYQLFNSRLDAHLEGLAIAGAEGVRPAFAALERWKKPGEAFVCTWLVAQHPDEEVVATLAAYLENQPDVLLRGAISALAWLPQTAAHALIERWGQPQASAVLQVVALRATAVLAPDAAKALPAPLSEYIASPSPHVRAAACRALGKQAPEFAAPLLRAALQDDEMTVRAEAAIALSGMPEPGEAGAVLWHCVAAQAVVHGEATGWYRMQATRRLNRWTRYLAWLAPLGHADLPALFDHLPPRVGLTFALYHGDSAHLGRVLAALADPETARYAGWIWQSLTGVDLEAAGLTLPEPEMEPTRGPITDAQLDADNGLPLPNASAIARYAVVLTPGTRSLLGCELTVAEAIRLLQVAPQAIRSVAALSLRTTLPRLAPNVRASTRVQQAQLSALQAATQA